jgi:hypothetical protein
MRIRQLICIYSLLLLCPAIFGQDRPDAMLMGNAKVADKYIGAVDHKADYLSGQLDKQTEKYLAKLEKQEAKLKAKLSKVDSLAAHNIFANSAAQYQSIQNKIKSRTDRVLKGSGQYLPWLDSASTSLKFLSKNPLGGLNGNTAKITGALSKVKLLENQFAQAGSVKEFIRQRKEYLSEQLKNYNLGSELKKYNQTAYYYTQQVNEYKQALDDPDKAVNKAMQLLNKLPAFQKFMKEHGMLAGLFDIPQDYATNMTGLQTRQQVQAIMASQVQRMGPNGQQMVSQSIGSAQAELSKLRNRFPSSGATEDMPDFKPKETKTKTFLQRLEYGTNIQTAKSNYFFPTTTDIAASVGYKISDKNIAGIGASYKMGWGKDIQHINLSSQGIGFRSFVDINLKGSFFVSGGFEYNYQQPFQSISAINNLRSWQQSGLLGISKVVSMKTKFFKKTKLQLLWDMLSYQQVPQTQPIKFRVGYSF